MNYRAIDEGADELVKVEVDPSWSNLSSENEKNLQWIISSTEVTNF